jgi:hypothetical protein
MPAAKRSAARKPKKPLSVKKNRLRDLPTKKKEPEIKGGFAPPYVPTRGY